MATNVLQLRETEPGLIASSRAAAAAATFFECARDAVRARVMRDGVLEAGLLEAEQHAAHGLAWIKVYAETLRAMVAWAERLEQSGGFDRCEQLLLELVAGEYLARLQGGIAMSQSEFIRPAELGLADQAQAIFTAPAIAALIARAASPALRAELAEELALRRFGKPGHADESLDLVAEQFRRFAEAVVIPAAGGWHDRDELIPQAVLDQLAEMGVFGLTVPEEHGGLGMSKEAMCTVTEELSRGYIGVGSLGTRSEIAAELIRLGGTPAQKSRYLPGIASGLIIPTAVFTEPNTGSDLASLTTRAVLEGDTWQVTGAKTWITHAARADLMTLLVRTDPKEKGWRGLSMLLAEKPRGTDADPFPVAGLSGSEIPVLGYRGMKEYALSFDAFSVPAANLLGGSEGQGFKQLMQTFESARIQTAARAVGVAVAALEQGLGYAQSRSQFGKPLLAFPRVRDKLVMMAGEIQAARQLTLMAAREKDADRRCDLEAGLAKLLAAQVAWSAADNALQIHGGNGYAIEYPISRLLCDSRILNIFEGAAEIQAQVIARRLLAD